MRRKRILAGILALCSVLSISGCASRKPVESDVSQTSMQSTTMATTETTEPESVSVLGNLVRSEKPNTNIFFANRKAYYEYTNESLNALIDEILSIPNPVKIDMEKYVGEEYESLIELDYFKKEKETYPSDYSWLSDGKIDTGALSKKIIRNNISKLLPVDLRIQKYCKFEAQAVECCYNYLKEKYPSFDTSRMLYLADNVTVTVIDFEQNISLYAPDRNEIGFNPDNISTDNVLLQSACHETFHMLCSKNVSNEEYPVYQEGASFDSLTNINSSMSLDFLCEYMVDGFAYQAAGLGEEWIYEKEGTILTALSKATGKEISYFLRAFLFGNQNELISAFEPELQDFKTAYSIYSFGCAATDYASYEMDPQKDKYQFEWECRGCFAMLCMKNKAIQALKEYYSGDLTYEELQERIENLWYDFNLIIYSEYSDEPEFRDTFDKLIEIVSRVPQE